MDKYPEKRIEWARRRLGIGPTATMEEIKTAYRQASKSAHPDRGGQENDMGEVNEAHSIIMAYIKGYKYSFRPDEIIRQYPESMLANRMDDGIMWKKTSE